MITSQRRRGNPRATPKEFWKNKVQRQTLCILFNVIVLCCSIVLIVIKLNKNMACAIMHLQVI